MFKLKKNDLQIGNVFKRRIVFICIENFNREYAGKSLLANALVMKGYIVFIAHKSIIRVLVSFLPLKNHIFVDKGNRNGSIKYLNKAKKNKMFIYTFDEEGLMQTDFKTFLQRNHEKSSVNLIDGVFAWGPNHSNLLKKSGFRDEQILKTGNTRFDYYLSLKKNNKSNIDKKNDEILICSRFASANPNKEIKSQKDKRDSNEEYIKDSKKMLEFLLELPKIIRAANIKNKIVIRPHPSESIDLWLKASKGLENVSVTCKEPIGKVLLKTNYLIHNRCTTSIEAYLLKVKVISYEPIELKSPPNPNKEFINSFADYICQSNSEIVNILKNRNCEENQSQDSNEVNKFLYDLNEQSSSKIANLFNKRYSPIVGNNFGCLLLVGLFIPVIILHHSLFMFYYKIFNKKHFKYQLQKIGTLPSNEILKSYKFFKKLKIFSKVIIYFPQKSI